MLIYALFLVGCAAVCVLLPFPPSAWAEWLRRNRDWTDGLPTVPTDPTAQAQEERQRKAGESGRRLELATTEAGEGR